MFYFYLQCDTPPALDLEVKQEPPDYSALQDIFAEVQLEPEEECASSTDIPAQGTLLQELTTSVANSTSEELITRFPELDNEELLRAVPLKLAAYRINLRQAARHHRAESVRLFILAHKLEELVKQAKAEAEDAQRLTRTAPCPTCHNIAQTTSRGTPL